MNKMQFIAIMLFAIDSDMVDRPVTDVIAAIKDEAETHNVSLSEELDYIFDGCSKLYAILGYDYGIYNKYL